MEDVEEGVDKLVAGCIGNQTAIHHTSVARVLASSELLSESEFGHNKRFQFSRAA